LIGARIDRLSEMLLRRHVPRRAHDRTGLRELGAQLGGAGRVCWVSFGDGVHRCHEPEVRDSKATIGTDENVVGFEVAMDEARIVSRLKAPTGARVELDDLVPAEARLPLAEGRTGDVFHREVYVILVRPTS